MKQETVKDTKDMTLKELAQLAKEKAEVKEAIEESIPQDITTEMNAFFRFILGSLADKLTEEIGKNLLEHEEGSLQWIINKHISDLESVSKSLESFDIVIDCPLAPGNRKIRLTLSLFEDEAILCSVFDIFLDFFAFHRFLYINAEGELTRSIDIKDIGISQERVKIFIRNSSISEQRALLDNLKDLNKKRQTILDEAWADLERKLRAIYLMSLEETDRGGGMMDYPSFKDFKNELRMIYEACFIDRGNPFDYPEELENFSSLLGGYDNFVRWEPEELKFYIKGVLEGIELLEDPWVTWQEDMEDLAEED